MRRASRAMSGRQAGSAVGIGAVVALMVVAFALSRPEIGQFGDPGDPSGPNSGAVPATTAPVLVPPQGRAPTGTPPTAPRASTGRVVARAIPPTTLSQSPVPDANLLVLPPLATVDPSTTRFEDCDAVRAAGVAPLTSGQPGYRRGLDSDRNGIACDE